MDKRVQRNLEAAGYEFMDAEDLLELTEEERRIMELRMELRRGIREQRQRSNLTQQDLAERIKSSQSRVAKMESGAPDVSLDLMFRGFFAAGGEFRDLKPRRRPVSAVTTKPLASSKKPKAAKKGKGKKGMANA
jgi:DNA-binding XRE family transcriptional regulator